MGRHKDTWAAKLSAKRRVKAEGGKAFIPLVLKTGDPGRSLWVDVTPQELESTTKDGWEALTQERIERVRREEGQKASKLLLEGWEKDGRIRELERRNKELESKLERVHDVVHPDRSNSTVQPERPAPAPSALDSIGQPDRPIPAPSTSDVTH